MIQRLRAHPLLVIVILGIIARLTVLLAFPGVFDFVQTGAVQGSEAYDDYARNLLATGVYGRTPGVPDASIPPLYSYALALVYGVFGRGYIQVGLFHILLDALSMVMLYHIGKRLLPRGETVGLLATFFYALYPYLIFQNLTVIDNPLFITLFFGFMLLMILLRQRPELDRGTWGIACLGGLVLGISLFTRSILPPLAVLVGLWFLFRLNFRQAILRLLPVAIISLTILLPWVIRNEAIYHRLVPTALNFGDNFYQGNSVYTIPFFRAGYDVQWSPIAPLKAQDRYSPEAADERFARGVQYLQENPDKIPELLWVKFLVHWSIEVAPRFNPQPNERLGLDDNGDFIIRQVDANGNPLLTYGPNDPVAAYATSTFDFGRIIHRYYWGVLFLLGVAGIVLSVKYWREVSLLWFAQISMTLVYMFFHPSTRYRAPTDPLWFLFSAYAIVWLWTWWQTRRKSGVKVADSL